MFIAALAAGAIASTHAQTPAPQTPAAPAVELKVGDMAPDFTLPGTDGKTHKLSDYRGKTVIIGWFPKAGTAG
jgi:peroxiredoxin